MTKRQRRGPAWHQREMPQHPRERGPVRFEDAVDDTDRGTPETR
jgi:hypothetical protein